MATHKESRSATSWPMTGRRSHLGTRGHDCHNTRPHTRHALNAVHGERRGKPIAVAYSGGTAFNFPFTVSNFDTYIKSQEKMAASASAANATILMSNHTEFDSGDSEDKNARLAQAKRTASVRSRQRRRPALFHGHQRMRRGGTAQASTGNQITAGGIRMVSRCLGAAESMRAAHSVPAETTKQLKMTAILTLN